MAGYLFSPIIALWAVGADSAAETRAKSSIVVPDRAKDRFPLIISNSHVCSGLMKFWQQCLVGDLSAQVQQQSWWQFSSYWGAISPTLEKSYCFSCIQSCSPPNSASFSCFFVMFSMGFVTQFWSLTFFGCIDFHWKMMKNAPLCTHREYTLKSRVPTGEANTALLPDAWGLSWIVKLFSETFCLLHYIWYIDSIFFLNTRI